MTHIESPFSDKTTIVYTHVKEPGEGLENMFGAFKLTFSK